MPLDDEKIDEIIETWERMQNDPEVRGSYKAVADKVGVAPKTVKKYINQRTEREGNIPEDIEPPPALEDDEEDSPSLFRDRDKELADDFKDFMLKLNDEYSFGIKEKAINMMAGEIRSTGQLPSPSDTVGFLESADSGLNNTQELTWIGRQYDLWKDDYSQSRVMPDRSEFGGTGFQSGFGQTNGFGMNPHGQMPMQSGGQQQMGSQEANPVLMMMFQQMQQQMQEMQKMEEEMRQSREGGTSDVLQEKTREFLEARLQDRLNAKDPQEKKQVIQELRALRQEIQDDPGARYPAGGDDWRSQVIGLVQDGHIDPTEVKEWVETLKHEEEPVEVRKKRYDNEIREIELDKKSQRMEKLADASEKFIDIFGKRFAETLISESDNIDESRRS